jgi:hypothetical protein
MNIRIPRIIVFLLTDVQLHNHNRALYYYFILLFSIIACFIKVFLWIINHDNSKCSDVSRELPLRFIIAQLCLSSAIQVLVVSAFRQNIFYNNNCYYFGELAALFEFLIRACLIILFQINSYYSFNHNRS